MTRWAEVIGDPIAHSLSPLIHNFWLDALDEVGEYRREQVGKEQVEAFLLRRRAEEDWLGCNVTAPLKAQVIPLLDAVDEAASKVGAVNCIRRNRDGLIGFNTDLEGIAEALAGSRIQGARVVLIGAGGAAKAALHHVVKAGASEVTVLARSAERVDALRPLAEGRCPILFNLLGSDHGLDGADLIVNASPAGMLHADPLPASLLLELEHCPSGATVFDMVYAPLETGLLRSAREAGLNRVDGLVMLVGQARRAFSTFFGIAPPANLDDALRAAILERKV